MLWDTLGVKFFPFQLDFLVGKGNSFVEFGSLCKKLIFRWKRIKRIFLVWCIRLSLNHRRMSIGNHLFLRQLRRVNWGKASFFYGFILPLLLWFNQTFLGSIFVRINSIFFAEIVSLAEVYWSFSLWKHFWPNTYRIRPVLHAFYAFLFFSFKLNGFIVTLLKCYTLQFKNSLWKRNLFQRLIWPQLSSLPSSLTSICGNNKSLVLLLEWPHLDNFHVCSKIDF